MREFRLLGLYLLAVVVIAILLMCSCTTTTLVPIETVHTEHHHHTDSVIKSDSVITGKETLIRELDSAAMAEYGIRLKNAERAFLIQTKEFERQIQKLMEQRSDTVVKVDSVQIPVPVERKHNRWERICIDYGKMMIGGTIIAVIIAFILLIILIRKHFSLKS